MNSVLNKLLGVDVNLKPLLNELTKFRQGQQEIITLLKLILFQLGGQPLVKLEE